MTRSLETLLIAKLQSALAKGRLYAPESESERRGLRRRMAKGTVASPYKGLYTVKDQWERIQKREQYRIIIDTIAELYPTWTFCSYSAAVLYGLEVPYSEMKCIHIAAACSRQSHSLVYHHNKIEKISIVHGIRCDSIEQTICDCIRCSEFHYALAIADSALRILKLDTTEMVERISSKCKGMHGMAYVRDVFSYADPKAENGGESYARAVMIENGVMIPELQVEYYDPLTKTTYRDDFEWKLANGTIAGELDGMKKYTRIATQRGKSITQVLLEERQRESRLRNQGLTFARFTFDQVRNVAPFLEILDSCGVPRIGTNTRAPKLKSRSKGIKMRKRAPAKTKKPPGV